MRGKLRNIIRLQSKTDFQFWRTWRIMRKLIGHGSLLERIYTFLPKSVSVIVKQSVIKQGLMRNFQNWLIEGSGLKTTVVAGPKCSE
jgi:hypothetical protein